MQHAAASPHAGGGGMAMSGGGSVGGGSTHTLERALVLAQARLASLACARQTERKVTARDCLQAVHHQADQSLAKSERANGLASPSASSEFAGVSLSFGAPRCPLARVHIRTRVLACLGPISGEGEALVVFRVANGDAGGSLDAHVPASVLLAAMPLRLQREVSAWSARGGCDLASLLARPPVEAWLPTADTAVDLRGCLQQSAASNTRRLLVSHLAVLQPLAAREGRPPLTVQEQLDAFERDAQQLYREAYCPQPQAAVPTPPPAPAHPSPASVAGSRTPPFNARPAANSNGYTPVHITPSFAANGGSVKRNGFSPQKVGVMPGSGTGIARPHSTPARPKPPAPLPLPIATTSFFDDFDSSQEERLHVAMAEQASQNYARQHHQPKPHAALPLPLPLPLPFQQPATPMRQPQMWTPSTPIAPPRPAAPSAWMPRMHPAPVHTPSAAPAPFSATTPAPPPPAATAYSSRPPSSATFVPPRAHTPAKGGLSAAAAIAAVSTPAAPSSGGAASTSPSFDSAMGGFQTGSGRSVTLSAAALAEASKKMQKWHADEGDDGADGAMEPEVNLPPPPPPPAAPFDMASMGGFQTGRGKSVALSAAAMAQASKKMREWHADGGDDGAFDGSQEEAIIPLPAATVTTPRAPLAASTAAPFVTPSALVRRSPSPSPPVARPFSPASVGGFDAATYQPSFSSGHGKKIAVSAEAERRAKKMMAELEAELEAEGLPQSERGPPAAAAATLINHTAAASFSGGGFSSAKPFRPPASTRPPPSRAHAPVAPTAATPISDAPAFLAARPSVPARQSKLDLLDAQIEALEKDVGPMDDVIDFGNAAPSSAEQQMADFLDGGFSTAAASISAAPTFAPASVSFANASFAPATTAAPSFGFASARQPPAFSAAAGAHPDEASDLSPPHLPASFQTCGATPTSGQKRKSLSQVPEEESQEVEEAADPTVRAPELRASPVTATSPVTTPAVATSLAESPATPLAPHAVNTPASATMPPLASSSPTLLAGIEFDVSPSPRVFKRPRLDECSDATPTAVIGGTVASPPTHTPIPIGSFDAVSPSTPQSARRVGTSTSPQSLLSPDASLVIPATPSLESQQGGVTLSLEMQFDEAAEEDLLQQQMDLMLASPPPVEVEPHPPPPPPSIKAPRVDDYLPPPCFASPPHARLPVDITTFASQL